MMETMDQETAARPRLISPIEAIRRSRPRWKLAAVIVIAVNLWFGALAVSKERWLFVACVALFIIVYPLEAWLEFNRAALGRRYSRILAAFAVLMAVLLVLLFLDLPG